MWKWVAFLVFCIYAAAEIAALLEIGGRLGVGWTLIWMLGTAMMGIVALRLGGLQGVVRIHHKLREQELPTQELLDMGVVLAGAFMLIAPGFVSDLIGFLFLLKPVRWFVRGALVLFLGELLPSDAQARSGAMRDDVIEIRREE